MIDHHHTCFNCQARGTHRICARLEVSISRRGRIIAERIACERHVHAAARDIKQRVPTSYVRVLVRQLARKEAASAGTSQP